MLFKPLAKMSGFDNSSFSGLGFYKSPFSGKNGDSPPGSPIPKEHGVGNSLDTPPRRQRPGSSVLSRASQRSFDGLCLEMGVSFGDVQ